MLPAVEKWWDDHIDFGDDSADDLDPTDPDYGGGSDWWDTHINGTLVGVEFGIDVYLAEPSPQAPVLSVEVDIEFEKELPSFPDIWNDPGSIDDIRIHSPHGEVRIILSR
jgi:hypothetical protein